MATCLSLAGCLGQAEQSKQQEAVEYQVQQRDSAQCAELGMLPGSDEFTNCMARLGSKVQSNSH